MGSEINLLRSYPKTKRPIDDRGELVTAEHKRKAMLFGQDYFDGSRLTGYGGYQYNSRFFSQVARDMMEHYSLTAGSKVLDIGCAKGYLLKDLKLHSPNIELRGIEISQYAIDHADPLVKDLIDLGSADNLPYKDQQFDLVISINVVHSLALESCKKAILEMQRVSKKHCFLVVDAWRHEEQRAALMKWNLTGLTFFHVDEWKKIFNELNYHGDYWWFIAE